MIKESSDDEILDFLMNSEFDSDLKPDEFKYLLNKWRYFYRILYGIYERDKVENSGKIRKLNDKINSLEYELNSLMINNKKNEDKINMLMGRKLSWKERILGKIIIKENENK